MIRHALIELRPAVAEDFKDANGYPLYGAVFFVQKCNLSMDTTINYLQPETNKVTFKELFNDNRIFVFAKPNEVLKMCEETIVEYNQL